MRYPAAVLGRFDAPRHAGPLAPGPGERLAGQAGDLARGAEVAFEFRVERGFIAAAAFRARGCPYTIAACDLVAERLVDAEVAVLRDFEPPDLAAELDLPPARRGRLLCIEDALRTCWRAWDNKRLSESSVSRSDP